MARGYGLPSRTGPSAPVRVRSNYFFAEKKTFFAGANDICDLEFCTTCNCQLAGGGWEHTVSQCAHPSLQGLIINRHDEVVHVVRDVITSVRGGNASTRILADLSDTQRTRKRLFPYAPDPSDNADGEAQFPLVKPPELDVSPQCPEWDGLLGDLADNSTLHGYVDPSPNPPMSAVEDEPELLLHARRLNTSAPGLVRIGREVFPILSFRPQAPVDKVPRCPRTYRTSLRPRGLYDRANGPRCMHLVWSELAI